MRPGPLVVVGDTLLDRDVDGRADRLAPDAPVPVVEEKSSRARPGGAGLAAVLAAVEGHGARHVVLVTALGDGEAGAEVARLLDAAGVTVVDLGLAGPTPEKVRIRAAGSSLLRLDRNCDPLAEVGPLTAEGVAIVRSAGAVLVSDYGRGVAAEASVRLALSGVDPRTPLVWDPHPRGAPPVEGCRLVTPNRAEAEGFALVPAGTSLAAQAARAGALRDRWKAAAVAVTLGPRGALVVEGPGAPLVVPAPPVEGGDPCGAGDRFAATAMAALAGGAVVSEAVVAAVEAASRFVSAGGAGAVRLGTDRDPAPDSAPSRTVPAARAEDVIAAVRARGGTIVATGGCFDIVHAGHVALLEGARALGDCLVVCLNSDDSVRRLKGPGRPRSPQGDRAAVLLALSCVDAVAVFDESTPAAILDRLRPDVFVKGGDYAGADLPEAETLARWGGQVAVLPYLAGRSTTRLLQEVGSHDA
ncbi:MAG TPA: PfkB family carbohydrate kinase [Acidimicrobiales bacterium]